MTSLKMCKEPYLLYCIKIDLKCIKLNKNFPFYITM